MLWIYHHLSNKKTDLKVLASNAKGIIVTYLKHVIIRPFHLFCAIHEEYRYINTHIPCLVKTADFHVVRLNVCLMKHSYKDLRLLILDYTCPLPFSHCCNCYRSIHSTQNSLEMFMKLHISGINIKTYFYSL